MTPFVKNALIFLVLIVLAAGGYYLFVLKEDAGLNDSSVAISESKLASERFLRELNNIKNIGLSDDFFNDERFNSLNDFSTPIPPQPAGKRDPFQAVQ